MLVNKFDNKIDREVKMLSNQDLLQPCVYGRLFEVHKLLNYGAKPTPVWEEGKIITSPLLESATHCGDWGYIGDYRKTNLHYNIINLLISANANVNESDYLGNTPLSHALQAKNFEVVNLLLENGAEITKSVMRSAISCDLIVNKWLYTVEGKVCTINYQDYKIKKEIGQGEGGIVFLAEDINTEDLVAIKILRKSDDPELQNHQLIAQRGGHKNIVRYLNGGIFLGKPCVVMEYIRGQTLNEYERTHAWNPEIDNQIKSVKNFIYNSGAKVSFENVGENVLIDHRGNVKFVDLGFEFA